MVPIQCLRQLVLQWGRGLSPAEISVGHFDHRGGLARLQWGRGLSPAEITIADNIQIPCTTLQWGRGLSPAEMRATMGIGWFLSPASMGPRAVARGNSEGDGIFAAADKASMGPRAVARGNSAPANSSIFKHLRAETRAVSVGTLPAIQTGKLIPVRMLILNDFLLASGPRIFVTALPLANLSASRKPGTRRFPPPAISPTAAPGSPTVADS